LPGFSAFLPDLSQAAQAGAFVVVMLGLLVIGRAARLLAAGHTNAALTGLPSADLITGWALVAALFTLLGVWTPVAFMSLTWGALGLALVSAGYCLFREGEAIGQGWGRILVLLLPMFVGTLAKTPSEWDEFSQWLPNLRYLMLFDGFPGDGRTVSDSVFPSYPYALNIVGYLTGRLAGTLADGAVPRFNLVLLGALALLLVETFRDDPRAEKRLRWREAALALLAVTLLSPTFVPKLVLSNYADGATAVTLAFSAILLLRMVEASHVSAALVLQASCAVTALLMTKQANLVLLVMAIGAVAITQVRRPVAILRMALPLVPAAIVYLAWRAHVAGASGEMPLPGLTGWQWDVLPEMLDSILHVVTNKGGYFVLAAIIVALALRGLFKREADPAYRPALLFAGLFCGYTLFLVWVYLAVYIGYEGRSAASFWRYHTQLGGVLLVAVAALLPKVPWFNGVSAVDWGRRLGAVALVIIVLAPFAAARYLRFDIHPVKNYAREVAIEMAGLLGPQPRLIVVDSAGNGFMTNFVDWYLGFGKQVGGSTSVFSAEATSLAPLLSDASVTHAWLLSWSDAAPGLFGLPLAAGQSHLLARGPGGRWTAIRSWPFRGFDEPGRFRY
jgi:hypothetical protein